MSGRYRKSSHVIYECKYHVCWLPKYRYPILTGQVALRLRELVRQIAAANEVEIISGAVSSDHVHLYVSIPPSLSVSKFVQFVKGATSRKLQLEFEGIRKRYWGQHVWARGYFVATSGNVSDEMVREYIRRQGTNEEQEDEFRVLNPT
jgi:putative transposase